MTLILLAFSSIATISTVVVVIGALTAQARGAGYSLDAEGDVVVPDPPAPVERPEADPVPDREPAGVTVDVPGPVAAALVRGQLVVSDLVIMEPNGRWIDDADVHSAEVADILAQLLAESPRIRANSRATIGKVSRQWGQTHGSVRKIVSYNATEADEPANA